MKLDPRHFEHTHHIPLKNLIIGITFTPGGISPNDFWVLEISCVLAPPQNFGARAHLMLPKNQHHLQ